MNTIISAVMAAFVFAAPAVLSWQQHASFTSRGAADVVLRRVADADQVTATASGKHTGRDIFFGDSQTSAPDGSLPYPEAYSIIHNNSAFANMAAGGAMTADTPFNGLGNMLQVQPQPGDRVFDMIGTNDWFRNGDGPAELALFAQLLGAQITYLAGNKKAARSHRDWAFAGKWADAADYYDGLSLGKKTSLHGQAAEITFTGTFIDVVYTAIDNSRNAFDVYVDGVSHGRQPIGPPRPIATAHGKTYSLALLHLAGFAPGPHRLRLVSHIVGRGDVVIDWVGDGSNGVPLYLLSSPFANPAKFQRAQAVHAYNAKKAVLAQEARAKGFNVTYLDVTSQLNITSDLMADGTHLSARGRLRVALALP